MTLGRKDLKQFLLSSTRAFGFINYDPELDYFLGDG